LRRLLKPLKTLAWLLTLPLFMFGVDTDHAHNAFAVNDLALITHFLDRRTNFHYTFLEVFDALLIAVSYSSPIKIVGRQLHQHSITRKNTYEVLAHLTRNVREHLVLGILHPNPKHCIRQSLEGLLP
jgi:hypothetical protein